MLTDCVVVCGWSAAVGCWVASLLCFDCVGGFSLLDSVDYGFCGVVCDCVYFIVYDGLVFALLGFGWWVGLLGCLDYCRLFTGVVCLHLDWCLCVCLRLLVWDLL